MTRATPDSARRQQGFLEGRNSPADADDMARLFLRYQEVPVFSRALQIWERGDAVVDEMIDLGTRIHDVPDAVPPSRRTRAFAKELERLNDRAANLQDAFSGTLGQATRWARTRLLVAVVAMTFLLGGLGGRVGVRRAAAQAPRRRAPRFRAAVTGCSSSATSPASSGRPSTAGSSTAIRRSRASSATRPGRTSSRSPRSTSTPTPATASRSSRLAHQRVLVNFELCLRRRDGRPVWVLANESLIEPEAGRAVMEGSLIDITDRKLAEQQRWHQANHDALTDLPNRVLFNDRLSLAILHAQRRRQALVVMFLDLDHFKRVNDTLGHSAGDELLVKVADRLRRCIRQDDTVARVGGDEFLLLLNGIARESDAATMARKILEVLAEPFLDPEARALHRGVDRDRHLPGDGVDAETLVANVDTAMYRAKETGRNSFQFFTRKMQEQSQERAAIEAGLRRALPRGEFVLHYQPILPPAGRAFPSASRPSSAGAIRRRASCPPASSSRSRRTSASSPGSASGCSDARASRPRRGRRAARRAPRSP